MWEMFLISPLPTLQGFGYIRCLLELSACPSKGPHLISSGFTFLWHRWARKEDCASLATPWIHITCGRALLERKDRKWGEKWAPCPPPFSHFPVTPPYLFLSADPGRHWPFPSNMTGIQCPSWARGCSLPGRQGRHQGELGEPTTHSHGRKGEKQSIHPQTGFWKHEQAQESESIFQIRRSSSNPALGFCHSFWSRPACGEWKGGFVLFH